MVDTSSVAVHGLYGLTLFYRILFIESLNMWLLATMHEFESADKQHVVVSVTKLFVESASRIS